MLVCLLTLLAGCATAPVPATKTKVVYEGPPAALYPECDEPVLSFQTNDALARSVFELRQALSECRAGVDDLRQWAETTAEVNQ